MEQQKISIFRSSNPQQRFYIYIPSLHLSSPFTYYCKSKMSPWWGHLLLADAIRSYCSFEIQSQQKKKQSLCALTAGLEPATYIAISYCSDIVNQTIPSDISFPVYVRSLTRYHCATRAITKSFIYINIFQKFKPRLIIKKKLFKPA